MIFIYMFEKTFIINAYIKDTKKVIFSFEVRAVNVQRLKGFSIIADGVTMEFPIDLYIDFQIKE